MKLSALVAGLLLGLALSGAAVAQTCPAYTYTFSNGSTADATQVNANFTTIRNCANTNLAPINNPSLTGTIVITGAVGIGTSTPSGKLQVAGGRSFFYAGSEPYALGVGYTPTTVAGYIGGSANNSNADMVFSGGGGSEYVRIQNGGNVGIGTTAPSYPLYVNGTAYASGAAGALSDIRHKDRIETLKSGALDLVQKLRPVSFVWKEPKDDGMKGEQLGFIAQEVVKVLPSVVLTEKNAEKTMGIKYTEIIPVLTKAIQEQQAEIEQLKAQVAALKSGH